MMIAVLIDSRKVGSSGWINVRSSQKILVRGMEEGDRVRIQYPEENRNIRTYITCDCEIPLNSHNMVKAEIVKISEGSRIYVDLE